MNFLNNFLSQAKKTKQVHWNIAATKTVFTHVIIRAVMIFSVIPMAMIDTERKQHNINVS